jgi:OmpA-OmpF porin, OOP family
VIRRRQAAIAAATAAVLLAVPAAAQENVDVDASIDTIEADASVDTIEVDESVESLEIEREQAGRVSVSVSSDVLFAFDRARLTPKAGATIERLARKIQAAGGPVRVDGYTDSIGSDAYNLRLSQRRAAAVTEALRAELPGRIDVTARGHGEADPVAPNSTGGDDNPAGRARNRRVTISYPRR